MNPIKSGADTFDQMFPNNPNNNIIKIFDTTLRDGDQGAGCSFSVAEKILIAEALAEAGIDIIEAGFPVSRTDDAIKKIARTVGKGEKAPTITGLARAEIGDIDATYEAIQEADKPRIHTFFPTSDAHLFTRFSKNFETEDINEIKEIALRKIEESVKYAVLTGMEVQFAAEDALNSQPQFLLEAVKTAIKAKAGIILLPDTLGHTKPEIIEQVYKYIIGETQKLKQEGYNFEFSTHNHNDLGQAPSNSLAAVIAGATQVETTVLGIGERAGNAKLHETIGLLNSYGFKNNITPEEVVKISNLVAKILGQTIPQNEPIIGKFANIHGSGIHADGAKKSKNGTDIYNKQTIDYGNNSKEAMFFARGGAKQIMDFLISYGIDFGDISEKEICELLDKKGIVRAAAQKANQTRGIYTANAFAIYKEIIGEFKITNITIINKKDIEFILEINGEQITFHGKAEGENGLINATTNAINNYLGEKNFITVDSIKTEEKPSVQKLRKDFGYNKNGNGAEDGSEQLGISNIILKTKSGEKINTVEAHNDKIEAEIKAIIIGSLKYILQKQNS